MPQEISDQKLIWSDPQFGRLSIFRINGISSYFDEGLQCKHILF